MARKLKSETSLHGEFRMIGISSNLKDYRLCHFLNKELNIMLERKHDFTFKSSPDSDVQAHTIFYVFNDHYNQEYFLITNKAHNGFLFPQHRNVDLFLLICGDIDPGFLQKIQRTIQKLSQVQLAVEVKIQGIRNIDFILGELELYSIGFKQGVATPCFSTKYH